jgi:hypothetical protein
MPVQMIELEEVQTVELSDAAVEAIAFGGYKSLTQLVVTSAAVPCC